MQEEFYVVKQMEYFVNNFLFLYLVRDSVSQIFCTKVDYRLPCTQLSKQNNI